MKTSYHWSIALFGLLATFVATVGLTGGMSGCGEGGGTDGTVSAVAGDDAEVLIGSEAELDGLSSTGVDSARWTLTSAPDGSAASISDATSLTASLTPDVTGEYEIQLSINGGEATDSVTITGKNVIAAITVPGVTLGTAIKATVSSRDRMGLDEYTMDLEDTGGELSAETSQVAVGSTIASYTWEQVSGPGATETGGTTNSTLAFTAPSLADFFNNSDHYKWQLLPVSRDDTEMIFKLTVTSDAGDSDSATVSIFLTDDGSEIHTSSGLPNVGIGTTVYLSGPDLDSTGASATVEANENGDPITDWSWTLAPADGSSAVFVDSGTTTSTLQFPKFTPDVAGLYTVTHSSTTGNATSTNPTTAGSGTLSINAAEYAGVGTIGGTSPSNPQCGTCHDGGVQDDKITGWSGTKHASIFEQNITSYDSLAPEPYLWQYHTVGYNTDADNDGFDDLATAAGFTFPDTGLTFDEFTGAYPDVAVLANVQCENCHGPGSLHSGDPTHISFSTLQFGICGQCHIQEREWANSLHNMTGVVHGSGTYQSYWPTSATCVRCHNAGGFVSYLETGEDDLAAVAADLEEGDFPGITCAGCHDPHDATNEHQLRIAGEVEMVADGSTVDAGHAAVCYTCHDGNYSHGEMDCDTDADGITGSTDSGNSVCETIEQTADGYWRGGFHYNPQAPVLEGKEAIADLDDDGDDDFTLDENSFHSNEAFTLAGVTGDDTLSDENNKCVNCHMATGPTVEEEGYGHLGGHSFKLRSEHGIGHLQGGEEAEDTEEDAGDLELVSVCQNCHPTITELNRTARADYDGDGSVEGIQDEVSGLLVALTTKIKAQDTANVNQTSSTYNTNVGTTESGGVITVGTIGWAGGCSSFTSTTNSCKATGTGSCSNVATGKTRDDYQQCNFLDATKTIRRAVWNHNMIVRDGTLGIHNAAFTIQVLQGTYTAVGGNSFATDYPSATVR